MENIFITLPVDILTLIYMYDNTYHIKFKEVIIQINAKRRFDDYEEIYPYGSHSPDWWSDDDWDDWSTYSGPGSVYDSEDEINIGSSLSLEQRIEKQEQFRQELEMLKLEKEGFEELLSENNNIIDNRYRKNKKSNNKFTKIQKYKIDIHYSEK